MKAKALFICKQMLQPDDTNYGYFRKFSGLANSARFVSNMLESEGFESTVEVAHDNNDIDRLVTKHKPDVVFIEALWVVPEKFEVLQKLHPKVKWVIRIHSELSFLAMESVSMDWCIRYIRDYDNVLVAPNSVAMTNDLKNIVSDIGGNTDLTEKVIYLPNYYSVATGGNFKPHRLKYDTITGKKIINIGCFGAIRPFKNQLSQAVAAIEMADFLGFKLKFHINGNRIEQGDSNLKNIRALFEHQPLHTLVEHPWQRHEQFMKTMKKMDITLQVSFTESFNIVAADSIGAGVPVVASSEIEWVHPFFYAKPTSAKSITWALLRTYFTRKLRLGYLSKWRLKCDGTKSKIIWSEYLTNVKKHKCK